jgi:hypothetical protein
LKSEALPVSEGAGLASARLVLAAARSVKSIANPERKMSAR